jgi:N-acetylmuramoyl-L-alanine amidase
MPTPHVIKQSEHLSKIAAQAGFRDYRTIWDDASNAELKKKRVNPHALLPGDVLQIPDKVLKEVSRATGMLHKFKVTTSPLKLRLKLRDFDNEPIKDTDCVLDVEGTKYDLKTDGDGLIEVDVAVTDEAGTLIVPSLDLEIPVQIGHLDPYDEESGWLGRLINLGYCDDHLGSSSEDDLISDIEEFQCDYDLKVTGVFDDATKSKLKEVHGV